MQKNLLGKQRAPARKGGFAALYTLAGKRLFLPTSGGAVFIRADGQNEKPQQTGSSFLLRKLARKEETPCRFPSHGKGQERHPTGKRKFDDDFSFFRP